MGRRGPVGMDASEGGGTRSIGDSPKVKAGKPKCPDWLPEFAKAAWNEVIPKLEAMYELTPAYDRVIAGYCIAWAELQEATATLETEGRCLNEAGRTKAHPAISNQRSALKALREFGALLGLSPADRARVKIAPAEKPKQVVASRDRTKGPPPPRNS